MHIAAYKGPPSGLLRTVGHYLTRLRTWSKYSHAELLIDGVCYSSSSRDGGIRSKVIDLNTGRWDLFEIKRPVNPEAVKQWFAAHEEMKYDWRGIIRWAVPFISHHPRQWVCYEAVGDGLGLAAAHKLTADDLIEWAQSSS